jgi:hypothetical protein
MVGQADHAVARDSEPALGAAEDTGDDLVEGSGAAKSGIGRCGR